ncbi:BamA/TamA family outer membrane protein [Sneathia sp. DSM 16630]|uniref:BamA/TamA family outer membrane protein n=1 Tax=uncultured Sneathia sp. TaxID=278067 RepID=UPI002597BFCE|nr:POTRA domain-containing protein [uncultured Sneathia sp.]MBE2989224.1 BamA/TamA family outer membrane protein [Sneathia sp. DSM 16630]
MKNKIKVASLLGAVLVSTTSLATKVNNIEVKNLKELPKEFILQNLPVRQGSEYTNMTLGEIHKALASTNLLDGIKIKHVEHKENDTVDLVIEVEEKEHAMEALQQQQMVEAASRRTDFKVNSVKIENLKHVNINNILNASRLRVGDYFTPITVSELAQAIVNTGYFESVVPTVTRNAKNKTVDITLTVKENPIVKSVDLEGVTVFNNEQVKEFAGIKEGKVLNILALQPEVSPILQLYKQNGLVAARIEKATATPDGRVTILVSEGKVSDILYKKKIEFEDNVRISKNKVVLKTKPYIFERMTNIKKGELITDAKIGSTIKEFYRTGLYSSIEPRITSDPNNPNNKILTFLVEERPTTSINGQVAYETKEGFTGGLTLSDKNFLGRQQDVSISANFGTRGNYDLSASFFDPWIKGTDRLQLGANVFFKRTKEKHKDLTKDGQFGFGKDKTTGKDIIVEDFPYQLANVLNPSGSYIYGGSLTLGKGFKHNIFATVKPRLFGIKTYNGEGITKENKKGDPKLLVDYTLGSVTLGLSYDTRDDMYIPKNGLYITGTAELGYVFREKSLKNEYLYKFKANNVYDYYKQYREKLKALGIKEYDAEIGEPVGHETKAQPVAGADRAAGAKPNVKQKPVQPAGTNQDLVNAGNTLKSAYDAYNNETDATKKKDKEKKYKEALEKYNEIYTKSNLPSLTGATDGERLKPRPFYILNLDARAYHKVFKDKNSMAYRVTLGYASKGTPENMLFHTSDGTILRGYPDKLASILATATIENRTYINDYVQLVAFAEVGIHNNPLYDEHGAAKFYGEDAGRYAGLRQYEGFKAMFTKEHVKADIGIGARLTTPLGVIRLDYAWPLINKPKADEDKGTKKGFDLGGKFSFGFGQTF